MNTTIPKLFHGRLRWLLIIGLLVPATLAAEPETIDEPVAGGNESPFDDFRALDGLERPDSNDIDDIDEPAVDVVPEIDDFEAPDEPVLLRLDYDEAISYEVANRFQMEFEENPDFRQRFHSDMAIDYRPIDATTRDQLPVWESTSLADDRDPTGQRLLATISDYSAGIDAPHALDSPTWSYQLFRNARFSFRITDRGDVNDLRFHPPTNPVLRSSVEELVSLLATSHPALPQQPVEPGDHWTDTVDISLDDETEISETELGQTIELRYDFTDWVPCGNTACALIHVGQDIEATGFMKVRRYATNTTSSAVGAGAFLFDVEQGRIVQSDFNITADSSRLSERDTDEGTETADEMDMEMEVDSVMKLVE